MTENYKLFIVSFNFLTFLLTVQSDLWNMYHQKIYTGEKDEIENLPEFVFN